MKKTFFYMMAVALVLATACGKDDEPAEPIPRITMTIRESNVRFPLMGYGEISIDWGDETAIQTLVLDTIEMKVPHHAYAEFSVHPVTITGSVSYFDCAAQKVLSLDVCKNPVLTNLNCSNNSLKNLDVSHNTALVKLDCQWNELINGFGCKPEYQVRFFGLSPQQVNEFGCYANTKLFRVSCMDNILTGQAIDALFRTLHSNTLAERKYVDVRMNPGISDCDISIATNKGWVCDYP